MGYCLIAVVVFLLYIIYDINSMTINNCILNKLFIAASLLFLIVNIILIGNLITSVSFTFFKLVFIVFSIGFFALMIYTLFFSLPFDETYIEDDKSRKVVRKGMYGLSRHMGVFWFIMMYICLAVVLESRTFTCFAVVSCVMNLIYIIFQDNYSFIRLFDDYEDYKREVPFLIPSFKSIKKVVSEGRGL